MSASPGVICFDVAEFDPQIFTALAEHPPHPHRSCAVEIGENLIRKRDGWMVAGGHATSIAFPEGRVEPAYLLGVWMHDSFSFALLLSHCQPRATIQPRAARAANGPRKGFNPPLRSCITFYSSPRLRTRA